VGVEIQELEVQEQQLRLQVLLLLIQLEEVWLAGLAVLDQMELTILVMEDKVVVEQQAVELQVQEALV
jgi:hypothetical protein